MSKWCCAVKAGDELFAGYKRHRNARLIERHRASLRFGSSLVNFIGNLPLRSTRLNYFRQKSERLNELIKLPDGFQQFFAATEISSRSSRQRIYARNFRGSSDGANAYAAVVAEYFDSPADAALAIESVPVG